MSRSIFHPDSALMITMTQITDCIFLSLFWLVGCFPVVTAGTACAGLYDAVYHATSTAGSVSCTASAATGRRDWHPRLCFWLWALLW